MPTDEQGSTDGHAVEDDAEQEKGDEELNPDQQLGKALFLAFSIFTDRQREIRRLGRYVQERAEDIDDAKARAKELIAQQLSSVDENALDDLMESFKGGLDRLVEAEGLTEDDRLEVFTSALNEASKALPEGALSSYLESITRVTLGPPAAPMLFASMLVSLVGELETLFAQVARALYAHDPDKLAESGKTYTWSDIAKYDDLASFEASVRDHAVDKMLHGSFTDWVAELNRRFHVPEPARSKDFETLEVIQRRHLMVHNGGNVSHQYLEKLASFKVEADLHDELTVNYAYIAEASDVLLVVALSLVSGATFKIAKDTVVHSAMESHVANTCFYLLQEKRYHAVVDIVDRFPLARVKNELTRHIIQVNGWIALKQLGRFGECRAAVEGFDVSARSNDLRLAKLALLDRLEEADALAQEMLVNGSLRHEYWLTWPLLEAVRAYHEQQVFEGSEGDTHSQDG